MTQFYSRSYKIEPKSDDNSAAQMDCWALVPNKVLNLMNKELTKTLAFGEIKVAIVAMPKGKTLGRDSLLMEFSEDVAPTLLQAYRTMLELGNTSEFINKGLITLKPKSGDHSRLGNWPPITLLGSIYKILAKVLFQRL